MQNNSISRLLSTILAVCLIALLNLSVVAQKGVNTQHTDFGSSLKRYENKEKSNPTDKQKNTANNDDSIRVETNLVVNDVLVVNQKGNAILGLQKNDFVITEDGKPQEVAMFSPGENSTIPRSIVLIIDRGFIALDYIQKSIDAAKDLVDKLRPQDKMAIVTSDVKLLTDFTGDKIKLKNSLDKFKNSFSILSYNPNPYSPNHREEWKTMMKKTFFNSDAGRSSEFSSLLAVLNELFENTNSRPIVILQSNGRELYLLKPMNERFKKANEKKQIFENERLEKFHERNFGFADVLEAVARSGATIYPVIPGLQLVGLPKQEQETNIKKMEGIQSATNMLGKEYSADLVKHVIEWALEELPSDQSALIQIAKSSGGYADFLEKPDDADRIYSSIMTVINNRYTIGYYPTNQMRDGKQRNFKIEVRGHPEYLILARKTYYAPLN